MTQFTNPFVAGDGAAPTTKGDSTAAQAKQALSDLAVGAMTSALKDIKPGAKPSPAEAHNESGPINSAGSDSMKKAGSSVADAIMKNSIENGISKSFADFKVTDKDRTEAKAVLAKDLSDLIPEADRAVLKAMQGALIDGNLDQLKDALKKLSGDPAKLEKFVKEINKQFEKHGMFGAPELAVDSKGNVLVYQKDGNTAVSINPKSGDTTLRVVERQRDGTMVLKEGEVLNKKPADVLKAIGDEATRSIVGPWQKYRSFEHLNNLDSMLKSSKQTQIPHEGRATTPSDKGQLPQDTKPGEPTVPPSKKIEK